MKKVLLLTRSLEQVFIDMMEEKWFISTVDLKTKLVVLSLLKDYPKYQESRTIAFDNKLAYGYYVPLSIMETLCSKKDVERLHFKALHLKDARWREWKKQK